MSLQRYVKKPVVIEAVQWYPGVHIPDVIEGPYHSAGKCFPAKCKTQEGWFGVQQGDFIITGVQGERYPCKPDVFHQTYDPVMSEETLDAEQSVE